MSEDRPLRAIALATLSCCVWALAYIIIKDLQETYPTGQTVFLRYFFCLPCTLSWIGLMHGFKNVATTRLPLHFSRTAIGVSSQCLLYISIALIPLANSMALFMLSPLIVAALSGMLLQEKVGPMRWLAALSGFAGALIIINPGDGWGGLGSLAALAAAFFLSLGTMGVRRISATETHVQINFHFSYIALSISSLGLLFGWQTPDLAGWLSFALLGLVTALGQYLVFHAYAMAPTSVISPIGYLILPLTAIAGWIWYHEVPTPNVLMGSLVLILAGALLAAHEGKEHWQKIFQKISGK